MAERPLGRLGGQQLHAQLLERVGHVRVDSRGGSGAPCCLAASTRASPPPNGSRPVSASYSMRPTAYQSDAGVSDPPDGLLGRHVRQRADVLAAGVGGGPADVDSSARPKSRTTTRPSAVTSTLDGLRSRCSRPAGGAYSAARQLPRRRREAREVDAAAPRVPRRHVAQRRAGSPASAASRRCRLSARRWPARRARSVVGRARTRGSRRRRPAPS